MRRVTNRNYTEHAVIEKLLIKSNYAVHIVDLNHRRNVGLAERRKFSLFFVLENISTSHAPNGQRVGPRIKNSHSRNRSPYPKVMLNFIAEFSMTLG